MATSPFLPTQLPNCSVWFDAADSTTFTTAGTNLLTWTSKGSISITVASNATNSSGTLRTNTTTINGLNTVEVPTNAGAVYGTTTNISFPNQARSIFIVFKATSTQPDYISFFNVQRITGVNNGYINYAYYDARNLSLFAFNSGAATSILQYDSSTLLTLGNTGVISWVQSSASTANNVITFNGSNLSILQNNIASTYTTTPTQYFLGNNYPQAYALGEYIFFNAELTPLQRQQVEGYLAWKWGNQTSLPATHPYRNFAPTGASILGATQLNLVNTFAVPGTIQLPSTFTIPGRVLTFKDQYGAFSTNTMTLTTNNANQTIDSAITSTINRTRLGWQSLVAGNNNRWFTVGGTLLNTVNTSTINTLGISTSLISTGNVFTSTLTLMDQTWNSTNTMFIQSTFLYYNTRGVSTIISGTRQSFGRVLVRPATQFQPNQITGLRLWFDAADLNTLIINNGVVTEWYDKSPGVNNTTAVSGTVLYTKSGINQNGSLLFNNSYFTGGIKTTFNGSPVYSFIVASFNATTQSFSRLLSLGRPGVSDTNSSTTCAPFLRNTGVAQLYTVANNLGTTPQNITYGVPFLSQSYFTGTTMGTNLNGSLTFQTTNVTTSFNLTSYGIGESTDTADVSQFMGEICEIISYFGTTLTVAQGQQVEGYLAWKWGLVGNLPANHLYKNSPP